MLALLADIASDTLETRRHAHQIDYLVSALEAVEGSGAITDAGPSDDSGPRIVWVNEAITPHGLCSPRADRRTRPRFGRPPKPTVCTDRPRGCPFQSPLPRTPAKYVVGYSARLLAGAPCAGSASRSSASTTSTSPLSARRSSVPPCRHCWAPGPTQPAQGTPPQAMNRPNLIRNEGAPYRTHTDGHP